MSEQSIEELERQFPSVELAYPIAVNSYEVAMKRIDALDGRLQTIMAFIVTVTAGISTVASQRGVSFRSGWFACSAVLFVASMVLGVWARHSGTIRLLRPSSIKEWVDDDPWVFKNDMIHFAAIAFDKNMAVAKRKWQASVWITALFALQAVCQTGWVISAHP